MDNAILLDDEYYHLLKEGLVTVDGVSVLDLEYINGKGKG